MRIRNKLLLASSFPIVLLVVQVVVVNLAIRELQSAVQFIGSAQTTIEADFAAASAIETLRGHVKRMPSVHAGVNSKAINIQQPRALLAQQIRFIRNSAASESIEIDSLETVFSAHDNVESQLDLTLDLLKNQSADLDTLIERAIDTNAALETLRVTLNNLAVELRKGLQVAVDRERKIHNLPIIAGLVLGSMAVILSMFLVWVFVDKAISRRLTALSRSMALIAQGDLDTKVPVSHSSDEISEMNTSLEVFRNHAREIEENNLRETAQARQQKQYWLVHMASFLRHELKNKQLGAEQSIKLLLGKETGNEQVQKYCQRAERSLVDMKELINSTVHAADIESALLAEQFNHIQVREFLSTYVDDLVEQQITRVKLDLCLSGKCTLYGDEQRLSQMLDKIVSNANDFRAPGTDIVIRATHHEKPNQVVVAVDNSGPGLPCNTASLFNLSVTARDDAHSRQDNVGFGLFVAKRIAEYHDGGIEASNTADGVCFSVTLPATAG